METVEVKGIAYKVVNGTSYHSETTDEVVRVLGNALNSRTRIRVFFGDVETGRDWLEEYDTTGYVGRSTGTIKIPLIVSTSRSYGGGALLDHCIVRITIDKQEVYRHPKYHQPEITIIDVDRTHDDRKYLAAVLAGGEEHAAFATRKQAERWAQFIKGERNSK